MRLAAAESHPGVDTGGDRDVWTLRNDLRVSAEVRAEASDMTMIPAYSEVVDDFRID